MKTAEEIIDEIQYGQSMGPFEYLMFDDCVRAMKAYAEQAIEQCAEDAEVEHMCDYQYIVNKDSILSVKSQLQ